MVRHPHRLQRIVAVLVAIVGLGPAAGGLPAATSLPTRANWIWSPAHARQRVPAGPCYFRKVLSIGDVNHGEILVTCDDSYELYINGRRIGSGHAWRTLDHYDLTSYLVEGQNVVALQGTNSEPGSAGLVAQVTITRKDGTQEVFPTGSDWKTSLKGAPDWNLPTCADAEWLPARSLGRLGTTSPWGNQVRIAGEQGRFRSLPDFEVEWVVGAEATGPLTAMAFTGSGEIVAAREDGPILLIRDVDRDGVPETVLTYCDQVTDCQGLLAVDGNVLAAGDGPQGVALYRLSDTDGDARIDTVDPVVRFQRSSKESGPHGVVLGPEGLIYLAVGAGTRVRGRLAPTGPYRHVYEGDLVQPRYEDPGGKAVGVKAPGGAILRTNADGSQVELVAGGLCNPYDLALNRDGELFTYDADIAADVGTPWYRPPRIHHVTPGAELGWRSGWAKWPDYYIDRLPAALHMTRGRPMGIVFYDHFHYPIRFHGAMFACDWRQGRIYAVSLKRQGATYGGTAEVFVEGRPLAATDIAVGPDGWLYFCTGGRGAPGGIYRVVWSGKVPPQMARLGKGIERAIDQPQLQSGWARRQVVEVQRRLGDRWDTALAQVARNPAATATDRTRALELMQVFGPPPSPTLLGQLSQDKDPRVRGQAAYFMGVQGDEATAKRLAERLRDADPMVRRLACEALLRGRYKASVTRLVHLLADQDRFVAFSARLALEALPPEAWQSRVLTNRSVRVFLEGSTALLAAHPDAQTARAVLARSLRMIHGDVHQPGAPKGFINDRDFTDLLRVIQLALIRGHLTGADLVQLRQPLAQEYPSRDATINRELVRLLVFLGDPAVTDRLIEQLRADIPMSEKLFLGMMASTIRSDSTGSRKLDLLKFLDQAHPAQSASGMARYLDTAARGLGSQLTSKERSQILSDGAKWPRAAFAAVANLSPEPGIGTLRQLEALDRQLEGGDGPAVGRLRLAIVAVLGRSRDAVAMAYLRRVFSSDPSRREAVAMGLAQSPGNENWPLLVRSLPVVGGVAAAEVLGGLAKVDRHPEAPEALRQVILCGLRNQTRCGQQAVTVLEKWTGHHLSEHSESPASALSKWQTWFAETYPGEPAPQLPADPPRTKWTYQELLSFLASPAANSGDARRGAVVFHRAWCARCHQHGDQGTPFGPDLTTVGRRLHRKEILESVLFPSQVIPAPHAGKIIVTAEGHTRAGIPTGSKGDTLVLLQPGGGRASVAVDRIEELVPRRGSAMPDGLFGILTLDEIADLFAFLEEPPRTTVTSRRIPASQ